MQKSYRVFLICSLLTVGCASNTNPPSAPSETATSAAIGHYMMAYGVKIFKVGDEVTLVLPADNFFEASSPAFNVYSYHALNEITVLLSRYPNTTIKVSGYTDNVGSAQRNFALSQQRAKNIADYLWAHGIDTRLLYSEGKGDCLPVASNATAGGREANRRIEIQLRV